MNSRQLEYVVAVSETLNFSEAAKQLYVSQPSLSQYIKKVEAEIGAEIFVRTTPLKLTYEGEIFIRYAKTVLNEERNLALAMSDISENKIGEIKIGAGPLNSAGVLPHILDDFIKKNRDVKISISEAAEADLVDMLDNGEVDIILTVMNPPHSEDRIVEEIAREQYALVIPEEMDPRTDSYVISPKRKSVLPTIDIQEIKDIPYIMQDQAMPAYIILEELFRRNGIVPKSKINCKNINTAIQLARRGVGACFVPSSIIGEIPQSILHCYSINGNETVRIIKIMYRKSMKLSKIHNDLLHEIRTFYKDDN